MRHTQTETESRYPCNKPCMQPPVETRPEKQRPSLYACMNLSLPTWGGLGYMGHTTSVAFVRDPPPCMAVQHITAVQCGSTAQQFSMAVQHGHMPAKSVHASV